MQTATAGVAQFLCAVMLFTCLDATTKYLAGHYPVMMLAWARYTVHWVLMTVVLWPRYGTKLLRVTRPGLAVLRGLCLVAVTLSLMSCLRRLPLPEASALFFTAPIMTVIAARPVLGERITAVRWCAVAAGFCGALLVVRPQAQLDGIGVAFGVLTACLNTVYALLTRKLARLESAGALQYYTALAGTLTMTAVMPWAWTPISPSWRDGLLIGTLGVVAGGGHFLFTLAYRHVAASTLGPLSYLQLLCVGMVSYWVFDHLPPPLAIGGMTVIGLAGAAVALEAHADARRARTALA
jgi:drug/metabolite transporter (DMT)-like permease